MADSGRPKRARVSPEEAQAAKDIFSPAAKAEAAKTLARLPLDRRPVAPPALDAPEPEKIDEGSLLESFMNFTPTTLVVKIWSREEFDKWQQANKTQTTKSKNEIAAALAAGNPPPEPKYRYPMARDLLDIEGAQKQCYATIEPIGFKPCYICGIPMGPLADKNGLSAECEHIMSVAQAVLLYKLYQSGDLANPEHKDVEKEFFSREYRWAHEICNRVKSDTNIITYKEGGKFELSRIKLVELLNGIYESNRTGSVLLKEKIKNKDTWIQSRLAEDGVSKEVGPLVEYLNSQLREGGDRMFALVSAANILERVHEDFKKIEPVAVGKKFQLRIEAGEEIGSEKSLAEISAPVGQRQPKRGREGGKRHKTHRMRRCRLPKLL